MSLQFTRNQLRAFLCVMLGMDAILIGAILGLTLSPMMGLVGFAGAMLLPFLIFRGVVPVLAGAMGWWKLQRLYPPVGSPIYEEKAPLTSLALRLPFLGINNCIEAVQDERYLHLRIFGLIGPPMMPVSIPWGAMTSITVPRRGVAAVVLDQGPRMWFVENLLAREIELREELAAADQPDEVGGP